jgi:hypothetical protein
MATSKKDINDVTDDISMIMREVVDATEANMLTEIALSLNIDTEKLKSPKDYLIKQASQQKALHQRLLALSKEAENLQINIAKNIGTYAGINTSPLEAEIKKGSKILLQSAEGEQNKQVQKIYRLNKFNTSAQFIPDLKASIAKQTEAGIENGLPVTYKGGRKIGYREYMEMAVRTGIQQEIGEQQIEIAKDANIVFFLCDEFADCADDHADYQGKIYYNKDYQSFRLTDEAKQLISNAIKQKQMLSVQEVREEAPFLTTRPNCRHRLIPISIDEGIGNESLNAVKTKTDSVRGNYRPENYEALKQQRTYERNIRKNKSALQTFELLKKRTSSNDYDDAIRRKRLSISNSQEKLRELLQLNPDLSRERRRETRKILIKDLGYKYNLFKDKGQTPTPVTNLPPAPAPVVSKEEVKMNETVKQHYAVPEEKKVYVKKIYETNWKAPNANMIKGIDKKVTYLNWKTRFENIDNEPETDDGRKITAYYFKELDNVLSKDFSVVLHKDEGYYRPFSNLISVQEVSEDMTKPRNALTYTHELGHAIDYNLRAKFNMGVSGGLSFAGTARPLASAYRNLTGKDIREGTSYFQLTELTDEEVQKVIDAVEGSGKYDKEQIKMWKNTIRFSRSIEKAQLVKIGGRISKEKVQEWEESFVIETNAFKELRKIKEEEEKQVDELRAKTDWKKLNDAQIKVLDKVQELNNEEKKLKEQISENINLYFDKREITEEEMDRRNEAINKRFNEIEKEQTALNDEYKKLREEENAINRTLQPLIDQIEKRNIGIKQSFSQVDDFFDALSGGRSYELQNMISRGHGQTYFSNQENRNVEIFTHLVTLRMHAPRLYNALKKDYPDIFEAHEAIMADGIAVIDRTKEKTVFQAFPKKIGER